MERRTLILEMGRINSYLMYLGGSQAHAAWA